MKFYFWSQQIGIGNDIDWNVKSRDVFCRHAICGADDGVYSSKAFYKHGCMVVYGKGEVVLVSERKNKKGAIDAHAIFFVAVLMFSALY